MGAMARVAIAGCSLLALAACSGGAEDVAPPTTVTPSTPRFDHGRAEHHKRLPPRSVHSRDEAEIGNSTTGSSG